MVRPKEIQGQVVSESYYYIKTTEKNYLEVIKRRQIIGWSYWQ